MVKIAKSRRDVIEKGFKSFLEAQECVCPESLHEALCRSLPEHLLEIFPGHVLFREAIVMKEQIHPLAIIEFDIGIAEEGTEIVEGASEAHPLEVDEEGFSVTDHYVLGLEIAVYKGAPCSQDSFRQG